MNVGPIKPFFIGGFRASGKMVKSLRKRQILEAQKDSKRSKIKENEVKKLEKPKEEFVIQQNEAKKLEKSKKGTKNFENPKKESNTKTDEENARSEAQLLGDSASKEDHDSEDNDVGEDDIEDDDDGISKLCRFNGDDKKVSGGVFVP